MSNRSVPAFALLFLGLHLATTSAQEAGPTDEAKTYIVVFKGTKAPGGFQVGGNDLESALSAVSIAGGVVTEDLTGKIGVAVASSADPSFAARLRANPLVEAVGEDRAFKAFDEPAGEPFSVAATPGDSTQDPLEPQQWGMAMIHAPEARQVQMGRAEVLVAVLDTGIDPTHQDFFVGAQSNVDTARARSFVPGESPFTDTPPHGTQVAGIIAARKNGLGIVGVAPDVTLVPVKVVDVNANARFSWMVEALTYAGDIQANVISMSLAIDEDSPNGEQPWCRSDSTHLAYREALERAIGYARSRGALPVAVAGNGDAYGQDGIGDDLSVDDDCDVLPAETPGVVTVSALTVTSDLTGYSNYGGGVIDLAAPAGVNPGGGGWATCGYECAGTLSTYPGNTYSCGGGTSFATPHVSGVAALIVSRYGSPTGDGRWAMSPDDVESILFQTVIDIGLEGEDACFGRGRVDAQRAVANDTSTLRDLTVTACRNDPPPVPPNSCPGPQITDHEGDALSNRDGFPGGPCQYEPSMDIVSSTFTADSSDLHIALTIADLSLQSPEVLPGSLWTVFFDHDGTRYSAQASGRADSATVTYTLRSPADEDSPLAGAGVAIEGSFQPGPYGTIRFTVPRSLLGSPVEGDTLSRLDGVTYYSAEAANSPIVDRAPNSGYGADFTVRPACPPIGVEDWDSAPFVAGIALRPNQPNPFSSVTRIPFALDREARVTLKVSDVAGR